MNKRECSSMRKRMYMYVMDEKEKEWKREWRKEGIEEWEYICESMSMSVRECKRKNIWERMCVVVWEREGERGGEYEWEWEWKWKWK